MAILEKKQSDVILITMTVIVFILIILIIVLMVTKEAKNPKELKASTITSKDNSGLTLTNLNDPENAQDAATKYYVDNWKPQISSFSGDKTIMINPETNPTNFIFGVGGSSATLTVNMSGTYVPGHKYLFAFYDSGCSITINSPTNEDWWFNKGATYSKNTITIGAIAHSGAVVDRFVEMICINSNVFLLR